MQPKREMTTFFRQVCVKLVVCLVVMSKRCYSTSLCEVSGDLQSLDFERIGGYRYEPKAFVADHASRFASHNLCL